MADLSRRIRVALVECDDGGRASMPWRLQVGGKLPATREGGRRRLAEPLGPPMATFGSGLMLAAWSTWAAARPRRLDWELAGRRLVDDHGNSGAHSGVGEPPGVGGRGASSRQPSERSVKDWTRWRWPWLESSDIGILA